MNKENLDLYIECQDHTVSGENFRLYKDKDHDMLVTLPKPDGESLGRYYESEDYISHTDAKRSLFEKLYHIVKNYSLNKKVRLISDLNKGTGNLLDIGAGTGDFLVEANKKNWEVYGVEPNSSAKILAEKKGIILQSNTDGLVSNSFDVITMWHVLEHVPDLSSQIKELKRLLKPGGYLVVAVPNFKSYDASYYKSFWAAYDVPRHLWHFSKNSIQTLFEKEGIRLDKIVPLIFDSFYVSLLSEKHKNGKMNFVKAFWIGLLSNVKGKQSKEYSSHIYILKGL
ncbi:class I SAM-dependent methyltransferase [uncultured Aquimarina sp.]|uniref:class I SAM-dependent methyltransferase n=1 Tax=uncultured Aquimarina sp. TaxID=575652 RepID=UPI00260966E6|nr:class I SAM-dependent methyltransferase [uncultured Aquimarina sp.]